MVYIDNFFIYWNGLVLSIMVFLPPLLLAAFLSTIVGMLIHGETRRQNAVLQLFYTCSVGVGVAYVEVVLSKNFIHAVLPSIIAVLVVLFQLIGRLRPDFQPPFDTRLGYGAAALGVIFFVVCAQYFGTSIETRESWRQ